MQQQNIEILAFKIKQLNTRKDKDGTIKSDSKSGNQKIMQNTTNLEEKMKDIKNNDRDAKTAN